MLAAVPAEILICDSPARKGEGNTEATMDKQIYFDANRRSWDERVAIHRRDETKFYDVQKVLDGHDKLNAIEAAEIGDVRRLRIAHLQCHFGLDSICLARRGASVVGLDFSSAAVAEARALALSDLSSATDPGEESAGGTGLDLRMLKERPPRAIDTQNPYSQ